MIQKKKVVELVNSKLTFKSEVLHNNVENILPNAW